MTDRVDLDPRYVAARRVLLDVLTALAPQGKAVIVVGAQAVYLRTGLNDIAIAPYTTDFGAGRPPPSVADGRGVDVDPIPVPASGYIEQTASPREVTSTMSTLDPADTRAIDETRPIMFRPTARQGHAMPLIAGWWARSEA